MVMVGWLWVWSHHLEAMIAMVDLRVASYFFFIAYTGHYLAYERFCGNLKS